MYTCLGHTYTGYFLEGLFVMNKLVKFISTSIFLGVFVFSQSAFSNVTVLSRAQEPIAQGYGYLANKASTVYNATNPVMRFLQTMLADIKDLDYQTAEKVSIPLTNNQILVFSWGFGGSGDPFAPLPEIIPSLTTHTSSVSSNGTPTGHKHFDPTEFGQILIQNELAKKAKGITFVKNLLSQKLTPISLFVLKLAILLKDVAYGNITDMAVIQNEITRLVLRLSLVPSMQLLDTNKALSSYFPQELIKIMNSFSPEITQIIDKIWHALLNDEQIAIPEEPQALTHTQTITYLVTTLVQAYKQYARVQQQKPQLEQEVCAQHHKALTHFLQSDAGKASEERLKSALSKAENHTQEDPVDSDTGTNTGINTEEMDELNAALRRLSIKEHHGYVVPESLRAGVHDLQQKIQSTQSNQQKLSFEQRIAKQEDIAQAYENEATILKQELKQKLDSKTSTVEKLNFSFEKEGYEARIAELTQTAKTIREESAQAQELYDIRQALASGDVTTITPNERNRIDTLELRVGYLLDDNQTTGSILSMVTRSTHARQLLIDLNSDDEAYKTIRKQLFDAFRFIVQNSTHIQENYSVYDYLIASCAPEIEPIFDTATQQVAPTPIAPTPIAIEA